MKKELLRFENVAKTVDGAVYLDNFSFYMCEGETVGLVSTNDRGEGELLKLLSRNLPIDSGRIYFQGKLVNSSLGSDYSRNKSYIIGQKSSLIDALTIADNLFVMRPGFKKYVIDENVLRNQAGLLLGQMWACIDLDKRVSRLTTMERITVETVKAYLMGCSVLIFLYPDQMISQVEYEKFHGLLEKVKERGLSSLYFCHHHWILFQSCDRIAMFSNGRIKKLFQKDQFRDEDFSPYILSFEGYQGSGYAGVRERIFELKNAGGVFMDRLNLGAGRGECITVLDSDYRVTDELMEMLTGEKTDYSGTVTCSGWDLRKMGRNYLDCGLVVLNDHPTETFLFKEMTYLENLCFLLDRKIKKSRLKQAYIQSVRNEYFKTQGEVVDEPDISALTLTEKYGLVYNKLSLFGPRVLVIKKPFAYGDMHCRKYILERIKSLKESGTCVILMTNYITDCLYISDRIDVIREGKNVVSLKPDEYDVISRIF